jgi:nickel transport system permease protein
MTRYVALACLGFWAALALTAPWISPHDPLQIHLEDNLAPPSDHYPLGTDLLGRDIASRLLYGARHSLATAALATALAAGGGLLIGGGHYLLGAWGQAILDSCLNAFLAIPPLLLAMVVITLWPEGLILALALSNLAPYGRLAGEVLGGVSKAAYVEGAVAIGARRGHLLRQHLWPNSRPLLLRFAAVIFAWSLLNGAALSFLGLVGEPDAPHWGLMLAAGRQTFAQAPSEALSAGLALSSLIWAANRLAGA